MNEMDEFLSNFPRLKHFELCTNAFADLADGYQWEILTKDLLTFNFNFAITLHEHSIENILDSFRTRFWLDEKHWFVAYNNNHLYTIPRFVPTYASRFFPLPKHSTVSNNVLFYESITKLAFDTKTIETCHRFNNINTLELLSDEIVIESLMTAINLNAVKTLAIPSSMERSTINFLLTQIPHLQHLVITRVR